MSTEKPSTIRKPEKSYWVQPKPLFSYPSLPRLEITFYILVIVGCILYAYIRVYEASRLYKWESNHEAWSSFEDMEWPFGLGKHRKDVTDDEWKYWSIYAWNALPWFIGHSIILNLSENLCPSCNLQSSIWSKIILGYWIFAHCMIFGSLITGVTIVQGLILYFIASKIKSKLLIWIMAVVLLYPSMQNPIIVPDGYQFLPITLMSYKALSFLSYALDMMDDQTNRYSLLEMIKYAYYLPYSISLIVISKDQRRQWLTRSVSRIQWKSTVFFGIRIIFWYCIAELATYVFYFEALMSDPPALRNLRKDVLVNVGMMVGQFFHLKYVVIFGMPAFFARLDRMQPQPGPICITRLTLYSKIWRYFDRGLYSWFKEYIYLPLCRPTFSVYRKLMAMFVTYSFVLLWHGCNHNYVVWVILSICEIFIEQLSKFLYSIPVIRTCRERHISDRNFRRILAWLQVITFAFGLYSNFYFLGSSEAGSIFVERIFWQETFTVRWPFILLLCLGYCQSHMCMEVDRLQSEQKDWEMRKIEKVEIKDKKMD